MNDITPANSRRSIVTGALIWICLGLLLYGYIGTLLRERGIFMKHPIRYAQTILSNSLDLADHDPPGCRLLEAENAEQKIGAWETIDSESYSGGRAIFTRASGGRLRLKARLAPGEYELRAMVYSYNKREANRLRVVAGNETIDFAWTGKKPERRIVMRSNLRVERADTDVILSAVDVGQPTLLVDCISLRPLSIIAADRLDLLGCYAKTLGAVLAVLVCGLAWGCWLLRRFTDVTKDPVVSLVLALGLGLAFIGTATTLLGTVGIFLRPVVIGLLAAGLLIGGRVLGRILRTLRVDTAMFRKSGFTIVWLVLAGVMLFAAIGALAPAVGVDPLLYHLPIAKWLVEDGRFVDHPYHLAWGFPHLVSNLYAVALSVFNDPGYRPAVLMHACLGMIWVVSVYAAGKSLWGRTVGTAAAVLVMSFEGIAYCFTLGLADLGFAAFAGVAFLSFVLSLREDHHCHQRQFLILAALLAGAAAVCKVNGPTIAIALACSAAVWLGLRDGWKRGLTAFVLVGVVSLAVASPMYFKNYLLYGNPLHPFTCGFVSRDLEGINTWALFGNSDWNAYLKRTNYHGLYRWPYDWMCKKGVDWLCPGPTFVAGLLLGLSAGRHWLRQHGSLLIYAGVLMIFWLLISPLARFGWPWLSVLAVVACAPLAEKPRVNWRFAVPIVLLATAVTPLFGELERPLRMFNRIIGESGERAFHAAMEAHHAGAGMGPPTEGIRALNAAFRRGEVKGRTLIDTNLVAYADFPTVPAWYYLIIKTVQGRDWWKADGYPFLSMSGKSVSDDELLGEFRRLEIGRILVKKGTPRVEPGSDGRCHFGPTPEIGYPVEECFVDFIERWVREGRVIRTDYSDSVLYTLATGGA